MKRLFLGSVALAALSLGTSAAFAAEKRVPAYVPPPPPPPAYTWSGCYVGGNAGSSSGRSTHYTTAGSVLTPGSAASGPLPAAAIGANITDSFNLSGFIGGGQLGCNWEWGGWVFGIEGDGSATNKEGQAFETALASIDGLGARANWISQTQERWLVTARGRLGLTNFLGWFGPRTLVYVTGGGAWAKIDTSEFLSGVSINRSHQESNTRSGWTVGGGLEYALSYGWSVKGEFLYVKFDNFTTFGAAPFTPLIVSPREVKLEDYIWRAGLNYKFW
jgi:outer membrane immunogenic protein